MAAKRRTLHLALAGNAEAPKASAEHLYVSRYTYRTAYAETQMRMPEGASEDVFVTLEGRMIPSRPDIIRHDPRHVSIEIANPGGPDRNDSDGRHVPIEVWPDDLPALIVCLIQATVLAERDDVIPPLEPAGHDLLMKLQAVLLPLDLD